MEKKKEAAAEGLAFWAWGMEEWIHIVATHNPKSHNSLHSLFHSFISTDDRRLGLEPFTSLNP